MNSKLLLVSSYFQNMLFGVNELSSGPEIKFHSFMAEYNKNYATEEEYNLRFDIFKKNLEFVENHESDSFSVAINDMSDWTKEEYGRISGATHTKKRMSHRVGAG